MTSTQPRPTPVPYDPELEPGLAAFLDLVEQIPLRADTIIANREHFETILPPIETVLADRPVRMSEHRVPGPPGAPEIAVTVFRPRTDPADGARRPALFGIHGGGMVLGNRFFGVEALLEYVQRHEAVAATVEYRLAPDSPAPAQSEDCYAALCWFAQNATDFGFDPQRLVVTGDSAGGGLSAAVALMARDRGGPAIAGQLLGCPMLDDRNETVSAWQYDGLGAWDRNNNDTAWNAILGQRRGTDRVTAQEAPARAGDLSGLPPAFIDVGAAEVFRDEAVDYATRIWATGGRAELHVWAGGYHGFSGFSPDANVSRAAAAARDSWLGRILGLDAGAR